MGHRKLVQKKIKSSGFNARPTQTGRLAKGVYFWREDDLAYDLAAAWHAQCSRQLRYKDDVNQGLAVIFATLTVDEASFIDIETPEVRNAMMAIEERLKSTGVLKSGSQIRSQIIATLLREIESEPGAAEVMVLSAIVSPPRPFDYPEYLSWPKCYVAMTNSCIQVNRIVYGGSDNDKLEKN